MLLTETIECCNKNQKILNFKSILIKYKFQKEYVQFKKNYFGFLHICKILALY